MAAQPMTTATQDCIIVLVTAGSAEEAERIAETLVAEELVACANIVAPVRSIYRWQGRVQRDDEQLMILKTRAALFQKLARRVGQLHSYETPEVIALPIVDGSADYLSWLLAATTRA